MVSVEQDSVKGICLHSETSVHSGTPLPVHTEFFEHGAGNPCVVCIVANRHDNRFGLSPTVVKSALLATKMGEMWMR